MSTGRRPDKAPLAGASELLEIATAMAEVNSRVEMDDVLTIGIERAAALLKAEAALITFQSEGGWVVASGPQNASISRTEQLPEGVSAAGPGDGHPEVGDLRQEPWRSRLAGLPSTLPRGPYLAAPLRSGGQAGTLALFRGNRALPFSEPDQVLAQLLAAPLAAALHVARLFDQSRAGSRQVEALIASTEVMWRPAPFREVARVVAEQASRLVPGSQCLISIVPPDRPDQFSIVAGSGPWAERQIGREWPWAGSVAGAAMQSLEIIETTELQSRSALVATLVDGDIDTGRLIPLTTGLPAGQAATSENLPEPLGLAGEGRRVLGVIGFYRTGARAFSPAERELMDEFGKRVSLTLHRAELLELANQARERLRSGLDVTLELAAALDHREVIRRMLRRAVESVDADRASLARLDGDEMVVEDGYDRAGRPFPIGRRFPVPREAASQTAIRTGLPQTGRGSPPGTAATGMDDLHSDTRHWVTVPLVIGDRLGATLTLMRRSDRQFSGADMESIQLIGNAAAVALRNAQLYAMAHELSRSKSDFMNLAAHELRTPLSVISGYVSMLQDGTFGPIPADWARPLSILSSKAVELGGLVEDLLVAARLEAGTMPSSPREFDLRIIVEEAIVRCDPRAQLMQAEVIRVLPGEPVMVTGDTDHVARILDNLINNALTYTTEEPWVKVSVQAEGTVVVEDHGLGIPDDRHGLIFERFFRVNDPILPPQPGTGLGLHISRELARRYGGEVALETSAPGAGSRFALRMPALAGSVGAPPRRAAARRAG